MVNALDDLLKKLDAAFNEGDQKLVLELVAKIREELAVRANDLADIEGKVASILARLDLSDEAALKTFSLSVPDSVYSKTRNLTKHNEEESGVNGPIYPVWFATNRKPLGESFGSERNNQTTLGVAQVLVPEHRPFGTLGSSFWARLKRRELKNDHIRLLSAEHRSREIFFADINTILENFKEDRETSHALFFIHGYNVSFEEAAIRAAQLGVDLQVPATAFFSWPSRGNPAAYQADEATIEASEPAITEFLTDFAENCGADKVHVIAHSMGNRGLLRALQRIASNASSKNTVKLGQVFLAAPDVDRDLFLDLSSSFPDYSERTTLYASDGDKAVRLSSILHDAPRAGYFTPYTVAPGIDTIAVPDFDIDFLGHGYFAEADALLHDIFDLMQHNLAPNRRLRIRKANHSVNDLWELRR